MAKEQINARYAVKEDGEFRMGEDGKKIFVEVTAEYDFGENLADLVKKAGGNEEAIRSNAIANIKVVIQSRMRDLHIAGNTPDQIAKTISEFVPGVATRKAPVDPIAAAKSAFANMSPEKQKAFLKELQDGK